MSPYAFGVVALRIVAVFLVTEVLSQALHTYSFLHDSGAGTRTFFAWAPYVLGVLAGLAIWRLAKPIAVLAARGLDVEIERGDWSLEKTQRLALTLIGVWLVIRALPGIVVQLMVYMERAGEMPGSDAPRDALIYGLTRDGVELCLGLLLVLGVSFWSTLLVRIQRFGLENK